jgi:hypothetical protein
MFRKSRLSKSTFKAKEDQLPKEEDDEKVRTEKLLLKA